MSTTEYTVVTAHVVGDPDRGYDIIHNPHATLSTLGEAKQWGLREIGHDDFNIAVVVDGALTAWTWMGQDTEPPTTPDELDALAAECGWDRG